jgi:hypothetical protein
VPGFGVCVLEHKAYEYSCANVCVSGSACMHDDLRSALQSDPGRLSRVATCGDVLTAGRPSAPQRVFCVVHTSGIDGAV